MQPNTQPTQAIVSKRFTKRRILILGALVFLAAVGAVVYFWPTNRPKPQIATGQHQQSYSSLEKYQLAGVKAGEGIDIARPAEYQLVSETKDKDQANFSDSIKKPPMFAPLGSIWLASVGYHGSASQLKSYFSKALASNSSPNYQQAVAGLEKFVSDRFSPLYDLTYSAPQALATSNIKSNAWLVGFTAAPKSKYAKSPNLENYKGQLVFVLGQNAYYYVMAYGTAYNWDNNQSTWQQVTNSINIDQ